MLVLYDKATTSFDNLGIGVLKDFKSEPIIPEVLNGPYNLEFDYAKNGWLSENVVEGNIIKANGQPFRIWNIKKDTSKLTVLAKHIFFDLQKNFLENVAPTDKTGDTAMSWILNNTQYPNSFIVSGDCTKVESARYVRLNPIDAIYTADNCLLTRFGGEIELDNYNVIVHNKRGNDLGLQIRQGKNLSGVSYALDLSTVATRIMPIGGNGILLPEMYIDSPLVNNYFAPFCYKYEVDISVDEANGVTLEDCYTKMREEVQALYDGGIDKPTISISIDFVELSKTTEYTQFSNLETARLGDTCKVFIPTLNLNLTTRIVRTIYNCSKKRITKVELGTPTPNFVTDKLNTEIALKNSLAKVDPKSILEQAKEEATNMLNHPFSGYIYISEETGELYLADSTDINTAQSIWKFGMGGIGYSSTGLNGTFGIAITQDGKIVADFITTGTMSANRIEGYNELETKVTDIESTVADNYTSLNQTISDFLYSVQSSGGSNLINNSVGYAGTNSWDTLGAGTIGTITSVELLENGVSGGAFKINNKKMSQKITVQANSSSSNIDYKYSFSCKVKKNNVGGGYIKIYNDYDEWILNLSTDALSYDEYTIKSMAPTQPFLIVEYYAEAGTDTVITDSMLNVGDLITSWQQANGEILNTQVNIDNSGIIVKSSNYEINGQYTVINPLEFSGYAIINGVQTKVFSVNGTTTEVEKLKSRSEISMLPIKIIPITSGDNLGWAFVPVGGGS